MACLCGNWFCCVCLLRETFLLGSRDQNVAIWRGNFLLFLWKQCYRRSWNRLSVNGALPGGHLQLVAWLAAVQMALEAQGFWMRQGLTHRLLWQIWSVRQSGSVTHSTEKILRNFVSSFSTFMDRRRIHVWLGLWVWPRTVRLYILVSSHSFQK
jgi:hypothetical protein